MTAINEFLPPGDTFPVIALARAWRTSDQHVLNLVDQGEISGVDLRGYKASRSTLRLSREAVVAFLERRKTSGDGLNGHSRNGHGKNGRVNSESVREHAVNGKNGKAVRR